MRATNGETFRDCSPIFITGCGRSGTTLLQLMLNAHPNIAVAGELHFFDQILQLRSFVPELKSTDQIHRLFNLLPSMAGFQYISTDFHPAIADAKRRLLAAPRPSYVLFYRYLMEGFARHQNASRFGEKTPGNVRYLDALTQIFPDCRIIHIVRDPRAVVASRMKVPWAGNDVLSNAVKWSLEVSCARSFATRQKTASRRLLEIRYEDVVADPVRALRGVCQFIGEDYDPRMLEYHGSAASLIDKEPWKTGATKQVYSSSVDSWTNQLSQQQIFLIELLTRAEMDQYNYSKSNISRSGVLLSPWQAVLELGRWSKYKWAELRQRRKEDLRVYGDKGRLLRMIRQRWIGSGEAETLRDWK